jgi:hypothetical protein
MPIITYVHPTENSDNTRHSRYWNTDWILRVDNWDNEGNQSVEITSAIPPGPKTQMGGMMVAKAFVTFNLKGEEARLFMQAYSQLPTETVFHHRPRP